MIESGFTHLYCADLPASLAFYRDTLGFEETFRTPAEAPEHVELRAPGIAIGLSTADAARTFHQVEPAVGAPAMCFTLWVADLDAALAQVRDAGADVALEPRMHGPNRTVMLRDPEGRLVELVARG